MPDIEMIDLSELPTVLRELIQISPIVVGVVGFICIVKYAVVPFIKACKGK